MVDEYLEGIAAKTREMASKNIDSTPRCDHVEKLTDYDPVWRDGRIVCAKCAAFIRYFDGG